MLQGLFLVFSAAVIVFNLIAELAYPYPRPAGAARMTHASPGSGAAARVRQDVDAVPARPRGMVGLVVLAVVRRRSRCLRRVFADADQLSAVNTTDNPVWAPPSEHPPLGTDSLGRPIWDQLVYGSQVSLLVGVAATLIAIVIGTVVGVVGGFFGGWTDSVLSRLSEWFLVIPFIPLAIVLAAILGPSLRNIILVIGVTSWPVTARLIRAQVLTIKQRLYVERSRALGASERAHHGPPHPPERDAARHRERDADRAHRDPLGDDARVPRARRPAARLLGLDARGGVLGGRARPRGVVVVPAAGALRDRRRARVHAGRAGARGRSSTRGFEAAGRRG